MSLIQPSQHPAYVFRTAGGLYLTTQQEWGKVTAFRHGFVPSKPFLMSHHEELSVEIGISADGTKTRVRRPVRPDGVRPGMQSLCFQAPHPRNWAHTSDIFATYAGVLVSSFRPGRTHLLFGLDGAWQVNPTGTEGRPLESYGWDGAMQRVTITELLSSLRYPRILRISEEANLEGWAAFTAASPGWIPLTDTLERALREADGELLAIHRDPAAPYQPLVRARGYDRTDPQSSEAFKEVVETFWRGLRECCERCGKKEVDIRLLRRPVGEMLHFASLCASCAVEVLDATG